MVPSLQEAQDSFHKLIREPGSTEIIIINSKVCCYLERAFGQQVLGKSWWERGKTEGGARGQDWTGVVLERTGHQGSDLPALSLGVRALRSLSTWIPDVTTIPGHDPRRLCLLRVHSGSSCPQKKSVLCNESCGSCCVL
jgi:hypothetical protein